MNLMTKESITNSLKTFGLVYLGTPYTRYEKGIEQAFIDAAKIAAKLMQDGVRIYSPIAHTHPLAIYGEVDPCNHDIWMPFDQAMMEKSDAMVVATAMSGWQESYGVTKEIEYFQSARKPIFYMSIQP